jgi:sugar phosphate isomerase/epimerase
MAATQNGGHEMLIQTQPPLHLTYCLNIHPGETWAENFTAIRTHALKVRDRLCGTGILPVSSSSSSLEQGQRQQQQQRHGQDAHATHGQDAHATHGRDAHATHGQDAHATPFGLGLRLSAVAARELCDPTRLAAFRAFLQDENLYAFTINGFPYGKFHQASVKENVYRPDWQDPRRRDYTIQLADILAALLPEDVPGSISTVPGSYKAWIAGEDSADRVKAMVGHLADVASYLANTRRRTGRDICLALEPEPDCYIETTPEAIAFFEGPLMEHGRKHLESRGMSARDAENCLRGHIGVCLDTAHAAVEFEDLAQCVRQLQQAGVRIGKVQLSAALSMEPTAAALKRLADFNDPVYLHQVKAREPGGALGCYRDLPEALADAPSHAAGRQLRVHFHVPLFCDSIAPLTSTASLMTSEFWSLLKGGATSHAEIETYTFSVLPPELQSADVTDSIVREYQWVLEKLRNNQ